MRGTEIAIVAPRRAELREFELDDGHLAPAEVVIRTRVTLLSGWEWQLPIPDTRGERGALHQPGSIAHSSEYALDLLRRGRVQVRELVTHRCDPQDCQAAYERAVDRKGEQLGALFLWPGG